MINTYEAAVDFANSLDYAGKNYDAEQVTRWLDGAKINGAGKFIFVEDNSVHYGTTDEFHTRRGR